MEAGGVQQSDQGVESGVSFFGQGAVEGLASVGRGDLAQRKEEYVARATVQTRAEVLRRFVGVDERLPQAFVIIAISLRSRPTTA